MQRLFSQLFLLLQVGCLSLATMSVSTPVQAARPEGVPAKLTIGIEDGYFPYEYLNEKGEFTGFDVELIKYICKQLETKCKLERGAFDGLIPNLLFKKTDLVVSALSITDERKKRVSFSTPYINPIPGVYVVSDNSKYKQVKELKVIGVQQGTTLAVYLQQQKGITIKTYPSFDTAMLDLKTGRIQAVFESEDVAQGYLTANKTKAHFLATKVFSPVVSQGIGIAVRHKDKQLLAAINKALAKAQSDGVLAKLKAKYKIVDTFND
ncbi:substrate-binding periplasmic protein [Psittacicella hinzii]|uniref:Solute-binding protein family 3/N-terminal domain-containing protein n=1 Tax=Psittacicella hinzii TaxID=2028575 RepID=A0A3A1YTD2_9GAMM|nr:transporter substrate-binding domain-containing protein [Psittacicella hinzii]RIY39297.1 hypothetical protein CKF58_02525 [Psittacicella hinzii]